MAKIDGGPKYYLSPSSSVTPIAAVIDSHHRMSLILAFHIPITVSSLQVI